MAIRLTVFGSVLLEITMMDSHLGRVKVRIAGIHGDEMCEIMIYHGLKLSFRLLNQV
jgi:hypothetical protein